MNEHVIFEEEEKYLDNITNNHPDKRHKMNLLGSYYLYNKDYQNAEKYFRMAIENKSIGAWVLLGEYYEQLNNINEMIKCYEEAHKMGNYNATLKLADHYSSINYSKMNKYCSELSDVDRYLIFADYYENKKQYEDAETYYLMAFYVGKMDNYDLASEVADFYKRICDYDKMNEFKIITQ